VDLTGGRHAVRSGSVVAALRALHAALTG
jgi:hypothetical protein